MSLSRGSCFGGLVAVWRFDQSGRTAMPSIRIIAAALVALCSSAQAQDWPTRPVTMVVPFAAGGAKEEEDVIVAKAANMILTVATACDLVVIEAAPLPVEANAEAVAS